MWTESWTTFGFCLSSLTSPSLCIYSFRDSRLPWYWPWSFKSSLHYHLFFVLHQLHNLRFYLLKKMLAKDRSLLFLFFFIKMSRRLRRLQNSWGGILLLSACLCLSKPGVSPNLCMKNLFSVWLYVCVCLSLRSDWWYLSRPATVCTRKFCISCLMFCNTHTQTQRYKHVHTPLVSRYPVFPSPVTLSSWYCLSDSSWFVWVSVVTAQRPAPGDPDLSALSESWNRRWMAGSHLCPELCAFARLSCSSPLFIPDPPPEQTRLWQLGTAGNGAKYVSLPISL